MKSRNYSPSQQAKRAEQKAAYEVQAAPRRAAKHDAFVAETAKLAEFMARPENRHLDEIIKQHCGV